ncbi:hypothetical protein JX265_007268 [Neoarthrinium moseri]|uniref:SnoaL-like domain-containing protein n=1 Tax=Neoarthrinium moseri TaxID=1658444 RepID=A0A9Q0AL30_9PEZI|nr:hypothetical protein JX265_007268 [Neoarthrinium moseri]
MATLTVEKFLDYIRAFNEPDYDKQHGFYCDDIELVIPDPQIGTLKGKEGILNHYRPIHKAAVEKVIPISVKSEPGKFFLSMESYFRYKVKTVAVHDFQVEEGDVIKITCSADYDIDNEGRMTRITCQLAKAELLEGKPDLQLRIRDSESRAEPSLRLYNY